MRISHVLMVLAVGVLATNAMAGVLDSTESFHKSGSLGGPATWNWGWTEDNIPNGDTSNTSTSYDAGNPADGTNGAFKAKSSTGGFAAIYVQFAVTPGLLYELKGQYMNESIDSNGDLSILLKNGAYVSGTDNQAANMTQLSLANTTWTPFSTGNVLATGPIMTVVLRGGSTSGGQQGFFDVCQVIETPEPATLVLLSSGLLFLRRRRR
jgi:hypothetical protein